MKIGLIAAPTILLDDIDLLDTYSIEDTYSCANFKQQIKEATSTCDYCLIWIRGMGFHPLKYQTIPMSSSSNPSIKSNLNEILDATCQNFPHVDLDSAEFIYFGEIKDEIFG